MSTTSPAKTTAQTLLSLQSVASNTVVLGSAIDVSAKLGAFIYLHFGRRAATALTNNGFFRVEGSPKTSGDGHWFPLATYSTATAACEAEAVSGTVNSGTNVITVASTTNLTAGDLIFVDNGTIGNSEWGRIKSISTNVSVTIEDNLVNAQTGATLYDAAEIPPPLPVDLSGVARMRVVFDGSGTGQAVAIEVEAVYFDNVTTA
jgi:hypothetical protein